MWQVCISIVIIIVIIITIIVIQIIIVIILIIIITIAMITIISAELPPAPERERRALLWSCTLGTIACNTL